MWEDIKSAGTLLTAALEVLTGMALRFPTALHQIEGAMRQFQAEQLLVENTCFYTFLY